jgi:hypothetical protein
VRSCQHILDECLLTDSLIFIAGSGKSVIWSVISRLLLIGAYFFPVPPSLKISWLFAKLDPLSWPTFTSISGISRSKAVATFYYLLYLSFLPALFLAATSSTVSTRHMKDGDRLPSDDTLRACLKEMLRLLAQGRLYIVLDALDECPDSSGIPSPRNEVLQLVKELVELRLQGLHICVDKSARGRHPSCPRAASYSFRFPA